MVSIWEKESFTQYDYLVIGAGITGLSAAIELRKLAGRNASIVVLEKDIAPSGASSRNAGFACFGSFTEILEDSNQFDEGTTLRIVEERYKGIRFLIKKYGERALGLEKNGGYELILNQDIVKLSQLDAINEKLKPIFNTPPFSLNDKKINEFGFTQVKHLVYSPFECQLNPGMLMQALRSKCHDNHIQILSGAEVFEIEDIDLHVILYLNNGIKIHANKVAVCTNAFTPTLFPHLDIQPGRGLVLLTEPIQQLPFKGSFHFDKGYFYFRNYKNKILFGGGRNLDPETETTDRFGVNQLILEALKDKIREIILPGKEFSIETTWSGIMAFGKSKLPIVQRETNNTVVGARLNGMGVALGSQIGQKVARLLTDQE